MSEHVIQNPVPTPEQMAEMLGVSPARVEALRSIMRAPVTLSFTRRRPSSGASAMQKTSSTRNGSVAGKTKDVTRAKTNAR